MEIFGNMIIETIEIIRKEEESKEKSLSRTPNKGILKKSFRDPNRSEEKKDGSSRKSSIDKTKEIDPKTLQKLLNLIENKDQNVNVKDELEKFIKDLRGSGQNIQNILENIKLLKTYMTQQQSNQSQIRPGNRGKAQQILDQKSFIRKTSFKTRLEYKYNNIFLNKKRNPGPNQTNLLMSLFPTPTPMYKPQLPEARVNFPEEIDKNIMNMNKSIQNIEKNEMKMESMPLKLIPPIAYNNQNPSDIHKKGGFMPNRPPSSFQSQNNQYPYLAPYKKPHNSFEYYPGNERGGQSHQNPQFYRQNNFEHSQEIIEGDIEMKKQMAFGKNANQNQIQSQNQNQNQSQSQNQNQNQNQNQGGYRPQNYKTVPCRFFHSNIGCPRGDECHFIHDYNYMGVETPNMHKYVRPLNQLSHNQERNQRNMMLYGHLNINQDGEVVEDEENEQNDSAGKFGKNLN